MGNTAVDLLVLEDVNRSWGDRRVIIDAELRLDSGACMWVGGANGAGKTTLLRIAAGLLVPDSGRVALEGLDPERDRRDYQRRLGWLPAGNGGLYNRLTVRQNLGYWAAIALVPRADRPKAVAAAMKRFDLERLQMMRADRISMGERQRLRLGMTFLHTPKLVLLDEPHTSLDESGLRLLTQALGEVRAAGGGAIWCSPGRDGIGLPAETSYVIEDGRPRPC